MSTERTALYRLFEADGDLLYIGISKNPRTRFEQHRDKHWWKYVALREIEWFEDRTAAERAEIRAIRTEWPLYNSQHNERRGFVGIALGRDVSASELQELLALVEERSRS